MSGTLTLSGWTQPADAVAKTLPVAAATFDYSGHASPEDSFKALKKFADMPYIVAWSLGGQLALRAIAAGILKPKHVTIIGTPYQFVSPNGMGATTFAMFRENYLSNPSRSKERFHGLIAKGDKEHKRILANLAHHHDVENTARWLPWLDDLAAYSLEQENLAKMPPMLIVQGDNDAIVPHAQSLTLQRKIPHAELKSWAEVGHAPHVHNANRLWREITEHRKKAGV